MRLFPVLVCLSLISMNAISDSIKVAEQSYDIVVVGSGLAGLTATIQSALENPEAKILLLEKEPVLGGNSMKATSGINMLNTPQQKENGVSDSFEDFLSDTLKSGKGLADPLLCETLIKGSAEINDFLKQFNIDLSMVSILGGHSKKRTHRPTQAPVGFTIVSKLRDHILTNLKATVTVLLNTTLINIISDSETNQRVTGVTIMKGNEDLTDVRTKAVILATGGFAHDFGNDSLLREFAPHLEGFPTTNGPQAQGHGMKIARKLGCKLIQMDQIQVHPTGFVDLANRKAKQKILGPELLRGVGGIMVNKRGDRFCNELGTRDYVTESLLKNGDSFEGVQTEAFILLSQEAVDMYGKNINFYIGKGLLKKFSSIKTFAEEMGVDASRLLMTVLDYNLYASGKAADPFSKSEFPIVFDTEGPIFVGIVTPSLHYTMGGVSVDNQARMLKTDGSVFSGLFGAGEVTGGVHGGNRLGANSLMECVVFGRIAGKSASGYINKGSEKLEKNEL